MIDEQPSSEERIDSDDTSLEGSNNGRNEEWHQALSEPLPAWKETEVEAWKKRVQAEQEADRKLREAAKRAAL